MRGNGTASLFSEFQRWIIFSEKRTKIVGRKTMYRFIYMRMWKLHGATCDCCPTSLNFVIWQLSVDLEAQEKFLHSKFRYFLRSNNLWGNQSYAFCICFVGSCRGAIATFTRSSFYFLLHTDMLYFGSTTFNDSYATSNLLFNTLETAELYHVYE